MFDPVNGACVPSLGTALSVYGNTYVSNSITTNNVYVGKSLYDAGNFSGTVGQILTINGTNGNALWGTVPSSYWTGGASLTSPYAYTGAISVATSGGTSITSLNVTGNAYVSNSLTTTNVFAQTVSATGDVIAYASDDRLKNKLGNILNAIESVRSLNGFRFEWNDLAKSMGMDHNTHVGLSAQEVQNVLPEVVKQAPINNDYLTVQYEKVIPLIIEAIKELAEEIDKLKLRKT
jgi:hypothetical protein